MKCLSALEALVRAECGLAFVTFLTNQERLKTEKPPSKYDIRAGFTTAAGAAQQASFRLDGELAEAAKKIEGSSRRLHGQLKGPGNLLPEEAEEIRNKAVKISSHLGTLMSDVKKKCRVKHPKIGCCGR